MGYVALLRGINVGGNNKVDMKQLKATFESLDLADVVTYINSGNIIFSAPKQDILKLNGRIEAAIERDFGFPVKSVVRDAPSIAAINDALPASWQNDATMKCDVMFLWEDIDSPDIVQQLTIKPELEDVKYIRGALLWRVDRDVVTRSGLMRVASSDLYKHMTIRNCNTARKLHTLMSA